MTKQIFNISRMYEIDGQMRDLWDMFLSGEKTSEWRDKTPHWTKRLGKAPTRAWVVVGYPKGSLPRLEADILEIVDHGNQYEVKLGPVTLIDKPQQPARVEHLYVPEYLKEYVVDLRTVQRDKDNPNRMTKKEREATWESLSQLGWLIPIISDKDGLLGDGEQRIETCLSHGEFTGPVVKLEQIDTDGKRRLLRQYANKIRGTHDPRADALEYQRILSAGLKDDLMAGLNLTEAMLKKSLDLLQTTEGLTDIGRARELMAKDITKELPAFTVFDGRSEKWLARTRAWREILPVVIASASRRDAGAYTGEKTTAINPVSVFNHTLAEVLIRGYSAPEDNVLIPFMGEPVLSTVGLVLDRNIHGIELRQEQANLNQSVFEGMDIDAGRWGITVGDACDPARYPSEWAHLVISCPPYLWLEKYSEDTKDLSNMDEEQFFYNFKFALRGSYEAAKHGAFLVLVVGNVRRPDGSVVDLTGRTIHVARDEGWKLYNDGVYLQPIGTAGMRMGLFTKTRKLVRVHESVLIFYKGDTKRAKDRVMVMNESVRVPEQ